MTKKRAPKPKPMFEKDPLEMTSKEALEALFPKEVVDYVTGIAEGTIEPLALLPRSPRLPRNSLT